MIAQSRLGGLSIQEKSLRLNTIFNTPRNGLRIAAFYQRCKVFLLILRPAGGYAVKEWCKLVIVHDRMLKYCLFGDLMVTLLFLIV